MKDKELALDNNELRAMNNKKVVDSIDNIGNFAKEGAETGKAMKWYVYLIIAFLSITVLFYSIYHYNNSNDFNDFLDHAFMKSAYYDFNIVCNANNITTNLNNMQSAKLFQEAFNGSCIIEEKKGGSK